jgi:hypothetical protein
MLIQIRITTQLKDNLDRLVQSGNYPDLNTAAVVALENLVVAEAEHSSSESIAAALPAPTSPAVTPAAPTMVSGLSGRKPLKVNQRPACFSWTGATREMIDHVHPFPPDRYSRGDVVPVERWLFGQQNRILPLKVNSRLLIAFIADFDGDTLLNVVADEVSKRAVPVGEVLAEIDESRGHKKDDLLSTAFPAPDSDKSRQRFADQFIGTENSAGELSGMLIDWKIATVERKKGKTYVFPTQACIDFANITNPLFDADDASVFKARFSDEEITWALQHMAEHVHVESFAFSTLLKGIKTGAAEPTSLDRHLRQTGAVEHKKTSDEFVATQRAGAVSRMADLDLIRRIREGVRITYAITARGESWLKDLN